MKVVNWLVGCLIFLNVVDVLQTLWVVGGDPSLEANPIMSYLLRVGGWGALLACKTLLLSALVVGVRKASQQSTIIILPILAGATLFYLVGMSYALISILSLPSIRP